MNDFTGIYDSPVHRLNQTPLLQSAVIQISKILITVTNNLYKKNVLCYLMFNIILTTTLFMDYIYNGYFFYDFPSSYKFRFYERQFQLINCYIACDLNFKFGSTQHSKY